MLFWFRRDLRLADNPALAECVEQAKAVGAPVVSIFVVDPTLFRPLSANRSAFLVRSLQALRHDGVPLVVRTGDPVTEIVRAAREAGATKVFACRDFGPYGRQRDADVASALATSGIEFVTIGSPYAVDPETVRTGSGTSFRVFTPFHRVWLDHAHPVLTTQTVDAHTVHWHRSLPSDSLPGEPSGVSPQLPAAGEAAAHARWATFRALHLDGYAAGRNVPGADATSRLSVDLKFGAIHPRQLLTALSACSPGSGAWVFRTELAWREFYADVLWHRPETATADLTTALNGLSYDNGSRADERFDAWAHGQTGYPFIDAGMRQLLTEGWMHNRVRMAVASFLVKDLHLDWRRGAAWFMRYLVDGDVASNQHGWQWVAGTGTDAAPYYRIFNPTTQGRTHDPDGCYIRRWIPELASFRGDIHEPHGIRRPTPRQGQLLGPHHDDYPAPIVDHAAERLEALARLSRVKSAR